MRTDEIELRRQLVEYGKELLELGLVQGTWGNLSVRLSNRYMITTPSGRDYTALTPRDMVKVDIKTLTYGDGGKPTSEKGLHAGVYELRRDVGAVIHTHSKYCSIFAAAGKPMHITDHDLAEKTGELIYIADYAFAGTKALTKNVLKALGQRAGVIMSNHGMLCCGRDLPDAFEKAEAMEEAARRYIESKWEALKAPKAPEVSEAPKASKTSNEA